MKAKRKNSEEIEIIGQIDKIDFDLEQQSIVFHYTYKSPDNLEDPKNPDNLVARTVYCRYAGRIFLNAIGQTDLNEMHKFLNKLNLILDKCHSLFEVSNKAVRLKMHKITYLSSFYDLVAIGHILKDIWIKV